MPGLKTNERPGTRAVLRHSRMSAYKAREVLDLIRGEDYERAMEILEYSERGAAEVIGKLLRSCAANAEHNDGLVAEELFVSACFADEGTTLKRWRPRARGRATRIRKRTCHITVVLTRMPEDEIARRRARIAAEQAERRARRVAGARRVRRRPEVASEAAELELEAGESTATADLEGEAGEAGTGAKEAADAEALAALEEAREIESEAHHAALESEAESSLDWAPSGETEAEAEAEAGTAEDEGAAAETEAAAEPADAEDAAEPADAEQEDEES